LMNNKLDIYDIDEIQAVFDFLKTEKDIIDITESGSISTIFVNTLVLLSIVHPVYLNDGQIVTINSINYQVDNVDYDYLSFDISAVGLFHMSTDLIPVKILDATKWNLSINFKAGSRIEINQLLDIESKDLTKKLTRFPLVWMFINESEKTDILDFDHETSIKLAFVHLSDIKNRANDRLDDILKLILQPLLTLFVLTITSPYFSRKFQWEYGKFPSTKYNRFFYGSSDKNESVLNSPTDAIEVDISITFQNQY